MRRAAILLVVPLVLVIGWCARPEGGPPPEVEVGTSRPGSEEAPRPARSGSAGVDDRRGPAATSRGPEPRVAIDPPPRSVLRGRLVDPAGAPSAGAVILVYVEESDPARGGLRASIEARHVTGPDGRFAFRGLTPGAKTLNITARAGPEFSAREVGVVQRAGIDHDMGDVAVASPHAMVFDLRVVDRGGAPVATAVVTLGPYEGAGRTRVLPVDADGRARVRGWRPRGYFRIEVRAEGYGTEVARVVPASQVHLFRPAFDDSGERIRRTGERILAYRGGRVEARLVLLRPNEDGRCTVTFRGGPDMRWLVSMFDDGEVGVGTLVDGAESVRVAPGEYRLCAARLRRRVNRRASDPASGFEQEAFLLSRVIVPAADRCEVRLEPKVRGVPITGRVVRAGDPAMGVRIAVVDTTSGKAWGWPVSTDADGVFRLVVPAGTSTLELARDGVPSRHVIDVRAGVVVDEDGREFRDVGVLRLVSR